MHSDAPSCDVHGVSYLRRWLDERQRGEQQAERLRQALQLWMSAYDRRLAPAQRRAKRESASALTAALLAG